MLFRMEEVGLIEIRYELLISQANLPQSSWWSGRSKDLIRRTCGSQDSRADILFAVIALSIDVSNSHANEPFG